MKASRKEPDAPKLLGMPVPVAVPVLYLTTGLLWIFFSDWIASSLSTSAEELQKLSNIKGWGFVLVTAGGLYALLRISANRECTTRNALNASRARFDIAAEAGGLGIWEFRPETKQLIWDRRMYELYQADPASFANTYEAWQQQIHPDDRERTAQEVTAAIENRKPFNTTFRIVRPDGETRHIRAQARVLFDARAFPKQMIGTSQDITEQRKLQQELLQFSWLIEKDEGAGKTSVPPEYDDVTALNENGLILSGVGRPMLQNMADNLMALLDTCIAVYERNGDYAFGTFVSTWCGTLDNASRKLCRTEDNHEALACGKWCCHESCWAISKEAIDSGETVDRECDGGLRIYAVPIRAGDDIIGVINFGYGNPPDDPGKLEELAEKYQLPTETLRRMKQAYLPRPPFIIDVAKQHLHSIARLIGETVDRRLKENELAKHHAELEEQVDERTKELRTIVNAMAGREVRMAELKEEIADLKAQLGNPGGGPAADDSNRS